MPFRGRLAAVGFIVGVLAVTVALLIAGWRLGLSLSQRLDRTAATIVNLALALTPAAIVIASRRRNSPAIPIVVFAALLVVLLATFNLHAAVWIGPDAPRGSTARVLLVLSALVWPALAIALVGGAVRRRTGRRLGATAALMGPVAVIAVHTIAVWFVLNLLAGVVPLWLTAPAVVCLGVVLQFVVESEIAVLLSRRGAIDVPAGAVEAKSAVDEMTSVVVEGPLVVDREADLSAEIRWRLFGSPVLILSAAMARLDPAVLCAVLAHEYAHVSLGHLRARLWWSIGSALLFVVTVAALTVVSGVGRSPQPVPLFLLVLTALVGQRLVLYAVVRRQERAADGFAVSVAGVEAMRRALGVTSPASGVPAGFSIWMTHDSLDARLRALEDHHP